MYKVEQERIDRRNARAEISRDGIDCPLCKNKKVIYYLVDGQEYAKDCECIKQRQIHYRLEKSGLSEEFKKLTFENYITKYDWQKRNKELALKYVDQATNEWLFISGITGSGKTHLATAVSKALIEKGNSYKYMEFASEMNELLRLSKSVSEENIKRTDETIKEIVSPDVLYIDDFLKVNDYMKQDMLHLVFTIIDKRVKANKKTIITTEMGMNGLQDYDSAIFWRIAKQSEGYILVNQGNDKNIRAVKSL